MYQWPLTTAQNSKRHTHTRPSRKDNHIRLSSVTRVYLRTPNFGVVLLISHPCVRNWKSVSCFVCLADHHFGWHSPDMPDIFVLYDSFRLHCLPIGRKKLSCQWQPRCYGTRWVVEARLGLLESFLPSFLEMPLDYQLSRDLRAIPHWIKRCSRVGQYNHFAFLFGSGHIRTYGPISFKPSHCTWYKVRSQPSIPKGSSSAGEVRNSRRVASVGPNLMIEGGEAAGRDIGINLIDSSIMWL